MLLKVVCFMIFVVHWNIANLTRFHRTTGTKLSEVIDRFESISRISNGIALEIGLLDGSFSHDDILAELLHLGSLKPNEIIKLKRENIDAVMKLLKDLPTRITANSEVLELEDRSIYLDEIGHLPKSFSADFANFTGKVDYDLLLKNVKNLGNQMKTINEILSALESVNPLINSLYKLSNDIEKNLQYAISQCQSIVSNLEFLETKTRDGKTVVTALTEAKNLIETSKFVELLNIENKYRTEKLKTDFVYYDDPMKQLTSNVKKLDHASSESKQLGNPFVTIHKLIAAQRVLVELSNEYTAGFPNGRTDLEQLAEDVQNGWIEKRIPNSSNVTKTLRKIFTNFDDLVSKLKKVEDIWNSLKTDNVDEIIEIQSKIAQTPEAITVENGMKSLRGCDQKATDLPNADFSKLNGTLNSINILNGMVLKLKTLDILKELKDLTYLKSMFNFAKKSEAEKNVAVREVVKKMENEPELRKAIEDLKTLQADLVDSQTSIPEIVSEASKINMKHITEHYNRVSNKKGYLSIYSCLNDAVLNGSPAGDVIKIFRKIREFSKKPTVDNVDSVVIPILESQVDLKGIQDYLEKMKNPEVAEQLKESFPESKKVAHNLGVAAQGLKAIRLAIDSKSDLQPLLDNHEEMLKDTGNRGALRELTNLSQTYKDLDNFLVYLDGDAGIRSKRQTASFKSEQQVFVEAQKITTWKVDHEKLRIAIQTVNMNGKYNDALKSLKTLETLDLDFAKFKFGLAEASLAALDDFFNSFAMKLNLQSIVAPPVVGPSLVDDDLGTFIEPDERAEDGYVEMVARDHYLIFICVLVVFFAFFVTSAVSVLICPERCPNWVVARVEMEDPEDPPPSPATKTKERSGGSKVTPLSVEVKNELRAPIKNERKDEKEKQPMKEAPKEEKAVSKKQEEKKKEVVKPVVKAGKEEEARKNSRTKNSKLNPKRRNNDPSAKYISIKESAGKKDKVETKLKVPRSSVDEGKTDVFMFAIRIMGTITTNIGEQKKLPNEQILETIEDMNKVEQNKGNYNLYREDEFERIERFRICSEATMVKLEGFHYGYFNLFKNNYHNGNEKTFPGSEKVWIVVQDPMDGSEVEIYYVGTPKTRKESKKVDTIDKHLAAIDQRNVEVVIRFRPFEKKGKKVCARWHTETTDNGANSLTFGRYKVETLEKTTEVREFSNSQLFTKYLLRVTNLKTNTSKTVTVILYDWNNPKDTRDGLEILEYLEKTKGNVMLQDRNGLGPSCVIMGIKENMLACQKFEDVHQMIQVVRAWRKGAIRTVGEVFYMILCTIKGLMEINDIEFTTVFHSFEYYYEQYLEGKLDENTIRLDERYKLQGKMEKYCRKKYDQNERCQELPETERSSKEVRPDKVVPKRPKEPSEKKQALSTLDTQEGKSEADVAILKSQKNQPEKSNKVVQKSQKSVKPAPQNSLKSTRKLDESKKTMPN